MAQLQLAFTKKIEIKNQLTIQKVELKHLLEDHPEYEKAAEEIKTAKAKQQAILTSLQEAYPKLFDEIEKLKVEQKLQAEMLSDMAVTTIMEQGDASFDDPEDPEIFYEPQLKVTFKRCKKIVQK